MRPGRIEGWAAMGERPAGSVRIEAADFDRDFDALAAGLREHLIPHSNTARCRWLYLDNPHGRAEVVVARHPESGAIVGSGAVIPRRAWFRGVERRIAVMADFWVHPDFRALGPAVQLQRGCIARAAAIGVAFVDVPYGNMPAVYQRLRLLGGTPMASLVKPLRARPFVEKRVPVPILGSGLGLAGDVALRVGSAFRRRRSGVRIERYAGAFDARFDAVTAAPGPVDGVTLIQDSGYLEWRYRQHYKYVHDVFVAWRNEAVVGFLISLREGDYAEIMDLHPRDDLGIAADLLDAAATHARSCGAVALSASWLPDSAPVGAFAAEGFKERARRAFVARHFDAAGQAASEPPAGTWVLGFGDIAY